MIGDDPRADEGLVEALRAVIIRHTRVGGYPDTMAIAKEAYALGLASLEKVGVPNHSETSANEKIKNSDLSSGGPFDAAIINRASAYVDAMAIVAFDPIGSQAALTAARSHGGM